MYTSDHGERAGAHGMRPKAGTQYREETNIPMIIAHPDVKGGRATKGSMGATDLAPTLMELARLDADQGRTRLQQLPAVSVLWVLFTPAKAAHRDGKQRVQKVNT